MSHVLDASRLKVHVRIMRVLKLRLPVQRGLFGGSPVLRVTLVLLITLPIAVAADILVDLQELGVPVIDVQLSDSMVVVGLAGSLAEGDSLLKYYGGVFFTVVDSIVSGWEVRGIQVSLEEADLIFRRCDMLLMLDEIAFSTAGDEQIADWVLNHTRVFRH
jgi:hypothetical protein